MGTGIGRDFVLYHESISEELSALKNRVRYLIGDAHWGTDGQHKEAILRRVIRTHLPEIFHVGTGFVCYPEETEEEKKSSKQLDILITTKEKPTLFKDGELIFVTPDAVRAIVEVKTSQGTAEFKQEAEKLSIELERVRKASSDCWGGFFIFDRKPNDDLFGDVRESEKHKKLLSYLRYLAQEESNEFDKNKVINCVTIGQRIFTRFWRKGSRAGDKEIKSHTWHSYALEEQTSSHDSKGLAQAYFLSNLVLHLSTHTNFDPQDAWYPLKEGKEHYLKCSITEGSEKPTIR